MTGTKPNETDVLRGRYDAVCRELALMRGERDEAKAALKQLRTEHTNACGHWLQRHEQQQARIAELEAALADRPGSAA